MTSQYRHRRSSNPASVFNSLEPGEIAVNTANRQLTVGDAASGTIGAGMALLPIRIFDTRAIYATADLVTNGGVLYRANGATGPGSFDAARWDPLAGAQLGPFVARSGDTMTGHLGLPFGPGPTQAVRKDYIDNVTAQLATVVYVDAQDDLAVQKTGDTMSGPLTLPGNPTAANQAANKAYVDNTGPPSGAIMDFAMATPPSGWLECDGQAISRSTYAALFAAIGTTWGAGDNSTTFNVPNFLSRFRRHREAGAYAGAVGTRQNPSNLTHNHGINLNSGGQSAGHLHYLSTATGGADRALDHYHNNAHASSNLATIPGSGTYAAGFTVSSATGANDRSLDHLHSINAWTGAQNADHVHSVVGSTAIGTADSNEARPYSATVLTCIRY